MFQEGKASCCCGSDDELNDLGPGIALYFMSLVSWGLGGGALVVARARERQQRLNFLS